MISYTQELKWWGFELQELGGEGVAGKAEQICAYRWCQFDAIPWYTSHIRERPKRSNETLSEQTGHSAVQNNAPDSGRDCGLRPIGKATHEWKAKKEGPDESHLYKRKCGRYFRWGGIGNMTFSEWCERKHTSGTGAAVQVGNNCRGKPGTYP